MPYTTEEIALMDQWAGQVMNGFISGGLGGMEQGDPKENRAYLAKTCYQITQALILERRKVLGEEKAGKGKKL